MGPLWEALKATRRPTGGTYCWQGANEVIIPLLPPMAIVAEVSPTPYWGLLIGQLRWDTRIVPDVWTKTLMSEGSPVFSATLTQNQLQAPVDTFILVTETNKLRVELTNNGPLNQYYAHFYILLVFPTETDWKGAWDAVLQQEILQREAIDVLKTLKVPLSPLPPLT